MIPAVCMPTSPVCQKSLDLMEDEDDDLDYLLSADTNGEERFVCDDTSRPCCSRCGGELFLLETPRKSPTDYEFQEQIRMKQRCLIELQDGISQTKQRLLNFICLLHGPGSQKENFDLNDQITICLQVLVALKATLAELWGRLLIMRSRTELSRQACEMGERRLQNELVELQALENSNKSRTERLKYVRTKNFSQKEEFLRAVIREGTDAVSQNFSNLEDMRRNFITGLYYMVFPIEVLPLSLADEGADDYQVLTKIDCDQQFELDEGWVLGGVHRHPTPHISIVCPSLPASGDHTPYLSALAERAKHKGDLPALQVHPTSDPYQSTPAALAYIAHFVVMIAWVLDQPLPFPLHCTEAISDYGSPVKRKRSFLSSMAKLDDNIMYLCFSQRVPLTALATGHTLQNLMALVTHTQLGRSGAFECHPELISYRNSSRPTRLKGSLLSVDVDESQPPNISYATDTSAMHSHREDSDSEEWEDEERSLMSSNHMDWEDIDPSPSETMLFREEQIKMKLCLASTNSGGNRSSGVRGNEKSAPPCHEHRMLRLDYDSTYADFSSSLANNSSGSTSRRKVQLSATNSIKLMSSLGKEKEGEIDVLGDTQANPQPKPRETDSHQESGVPVGGSGLFSTLSSLWTSTFGGR